MFVFAGNTHQFAKRQQRYMIGGGIFDWIPSLTSVSRALGSTGNFVSAIKNVANVIGNVAKIGATTASAVKQIVDIVKAKRFAAAAAGMKKAAALPTPLEKALSEKSVEFLKHLARSAEAAPAGTASSTLPDINSRIAGAGFKTLAPVRARCGKKV